MSRTLGLCGRTGNNVFVRIKSIECVFFCNEASLLNVGIGSRKKVDLKNEDKNECLPHSLTLSSLHLH